ncbi:hypothetical protein BDW74DRAFT_139076 [Aspergillus multicolor]|uniref:uncharacterized protein n=1 Tax=Aspergillus multicolor TaxID=41759 RepID=UPI003CCE1567
MTSNIQLIDNTAPAERPAPDDASFSRTTTTASSGSRLWSRPSIRAERTKRKYAKWQPERLGIVATGSNDIPESGSEQLSSDEGGWLRAATNTNTLTNASTIHEDESTVNYGNDNNRDGYQSDSQPAYYERSGDNAAEPIQQHDFGAGAGTDSDTGTEAEPRRTTHQSKNHPKICGLKPNSELDILYENQRGWFFFGIPLYSNQSLLNIDPVPWINASGKRSFVDITNAQVPDPSWEWAWKTWYVDMSGDVDEQGWQYAFSFSRSSSWHGTHPFWHSFVRRRRWVRLRVKKASTERHRRSRTGLEMGHTLNEDYFTIHSAVKRKGTSSSERPSRAASVNLGKTVMDRQEEDLEEIRNIPTLMHAVKTAIVDREKLDAVRKFVEDGGEELYYLDGKVPEIMSRFVYQTSRWQLVTYFNETIQALSKQQKDLESTEQPQSKQDTNVQDLRRKQEYLTRAASTAERHLIGPEVLQLQELEPQDNHRRASTSAAEMLDLTPVNRRDSLMSRVSSRFSFKPMDNGGEIKGIPKEAEIGHDFHIY